MSKRKTFDRVRPSSGRYSSFPCTVISTGGVKGMEYGVVPEQPELFIDPAVHWYGEHELELIGSDGTKVYEPKFLDYVQTADGKKGYVINYDKDNSVTRRQLVAFGFLRNAFYKLEDLKLIAEHQPPQQ